MCTSCRDLRERANRPTPKTDPHNISVKICSTRKSNLHCRRISPHVTSSLINSFMPLGVELKRKQQAAGGAEGKMEIMQQVDEALLARRTTPRQDDKTIIVNESSHEMNGDNNDKDAEKKELSEKSTVYLDKNAGTAIEWHLSDKNSGVVDVDNIPNILNDVINKTLILDAPLLGSSEKEGNMSSEGSSKGHVKIDLLEEDEEEIELEFERAIGKMHTHNIYCPNCRSQVTRVILRRKKPQIKDPDNKPMGLLGCLSCFSIFIPSGKPESTEEHVSVAQGETIVKKGRVFDLFGRFGKETDKGNAPNNQQLPRGDTNIPSSQPGLISQQLPRGDTNIPSSQTSLNNQQLPSGENNIPFSEQDNDHERVEEDDKEALIRTKRPPYGTPPPTYQPQKPGNPQVSPPQRYNSHGDLIFDVEEGQGANTQDPPQPGYFEHGSKSLEILKSTVYGGLVESITSLSIVSSAAASETATMNIVALGLANVISGIFVIAHNLRDMKNECPVPDLNEQTDRYHELIGRRENFPLHFTFAILSFLLFGLIPPAVYGFAFEKTDNNKDYTIIAVAVASLICIILLSIGKAYCKGEHRLCAYVKTISYYVINAVAVSGVAYAMGDLIKILVEKLGWFEPSTPTPASLFNSGINSATPFKASY
ncbi:membrane protein of ER body-like protein [Forsythia ovata]|uniref:Membrane protein of ER body-like protein n=1 Tax=Forsythia ovata TaxID=205694 RepID=A0ABD1X529_9LAMI